MTPTLTLNCIRSIDSAEIALVGPITLIGGLNGAGKTSTMLALKACLTGTTACVSGKANQDGRNICGSGGTGQGTAMLTAGDSKVTARWTQAKAFPTRTPGSVAGLPKASATAAGLPDFLSIEPKERDEAFSEAFQIDPTRDNLNSALLEKNLADRVDEIWQEKEIQGWDGAAKSRNETITSLKADWRGVTGESWTAEGAASWAPIAGAQAVSDADYRDLEAKAIGSAEKLAIARAELAEIVVPPAAGDVRPCPHCSKPVMDIGGKLIEALEVDTKARDSALARQAELRSRVGNFQEWAANDERNLIEAGALRDRDEEDRAARIKSASEINKRLVVETTILELLGPDGVCATRREQMLHLVNNRLSEFSEGLTPQPVRLVWGYEPGKKTKTFCGFMGDRPLQMLSSSEQWRVRTIVQVAIAAQDGSTMVLLDDADILDKGNRDALIGLLRKVDIQAVVAMTMNDASIAPDLEKARLGRTYWIENGRVLPLSEAKGAVVQKAA